MHVSYVAGNGSCQFIAILVEQTFEFLQCFVHGAEGVAARGIPVPAAEEMLPGEVIDREIADGAEGDPDLVGPFGEEGGKAYILDAEGYKWWTMQGNMAATEMLYKDDDVEFWIDGVRYEGFLADNPPLKATFRQGEASLIFNVNVLFLKD